MEYPKTLISFLFRKISAVGAGILVYLGAGWAMAQEAAPAVVPASPAAPAISAGDTAWVLASAALVMLMTPGLGLFYGGMVRRKNVLATIMQSFFLVALIGVQWVIWGYSTSFSPGNDFFGGFSWAMLKNLPAVNSGAPTIPHYAFILFQAMFAIITPALITGAFAERVKFKGFIVFSLLWAALVYDPIAHMVWGGGFWAKQGGLDFAGGVVVHISAGFSALALAILTNKRKGYGTFAMVPHNMTMVLTGTGLLWFGWFGFNAGSALGANAQACTAFMATNTAGATATLMWCLIEALHRGKPTALGAASGAIAGLAAVTPAAGFVDMTGAICIGVIASLLCYGAILVKMKMDYDDSLDAFGIHGVGGFFGTLAVGIWANPLIGGKAGFLYGNPGQFTVQTLMALSVALFSLIATVILFFVVEKTIGFRASEKEEDMGLDLSQHGEEGYGGR
jgi:Amt family ammonium transporter